ncbi:MAG: hypothetical protein IJ763_08945 [Lachnospiraceae bacterium]|nr:hypothetical protein [Lachnospiraceae bacterium]
MRYLQKKSICYLCIIMIFILICGCKADSTYENEISNTEQSIVESIIKEYDFIDPMIEQAIRDELSVDSDYTITQSDLDKVTELRIDNRYRTWIVELANMNPNEFLLVLDLSDLANLNNLETLIIENTNRDYISNLSAIKECKNLKSLTMFYFEFDYESNMGFGQKELLDIVSSCTNLTYLNTQKNLSDDLYEQIYSLNSNIVTYAPAGDEYVYEDRNKKIVLNSFSQYATEFEASDNVKVVKVFDDETLDKAINNDNVEHIILCCSDIDINKLKDKKGLKSLTFDFPKSGRTSIQPVIRNFESLKDMNQLCNLYFLPASGFNSENKMIIDGDVNTICDMPNLKRIALYTDNFDSIDFSKMTNLESLSVNSLSKNINIKPLKQLRELQYVCDSYTIDNIEDFDNLKKLILTCIDDFDIGKFNDFNELRMLMVKGIDNYCYANEFSGLNNLSYFKIDSKFDESMENIARSGNLKNININIWRYEYYGTTFYERYQYSWEMDLEPFTSLNNLSYFGTGYFLNDMQIDFGFIKDLKGVLELERNGVYIDVVDYYKYGDEHNQNIYSNQIEQYVYESGQEHASSQSENSLKGESDFQKEVDICNAKTIKTAIEYTLIDENAYETMTTMFGNKIIKIDSMENELPIEITSEIRREIGDIELKPEYIEGGILGFSFSVSTDGVVNVYVYDSENEAKYELVPETDEDYLQ